MSIIQTVDFNLFDQAFIQAGRKDNFSYTGLQLLWDILDSYYSNPDENIELDVVGLCCEFSEDTLKEFIYNYAGAEDNFNEAKQEIDLDYLAEYLVKNLDNILKDKEIIKTYFSNLYNDNYYYISDNKINYNSTESDIIQIMLDQIIDNNYQEFLNLVCDIENDADYLEAIDSIMYDIVTEYLDNESGLYMISDCRTIVVYQAF